VALGSYDCLIPSFSPLALFNTLRPLGDDEAGEPAAVVHIWLRDVEPIAVADSLRRFLDSAKFVFFSNWQQDASFDVYMGDIDAADNTVSRCEASLGRRRPSHPAPIVIRLRQHPWNYRMGILSLILRSGDMREFERRLVAPIGIIFQKFIVESIDERPAY